MPRTCFLQAGLIALSTLALFAARPAHAQLSFTYTSFDAGLDQPIFLGSSNSGALVGTYGATTPYQGFIYQNGVATTVNYTGYVPNSETDILSINSAGIATGNYYDYTANTGTYFLYNSNTRTFSSPAHSNATETAYNGINDAGLVATPYLDATGFHSAIYSTVTQAFIEDLPDEGIYGTYATFVAPNGDVLVNYLDVNGNFHGSLLHNGIYTPLDFPGATSTNVDSINANGLILGRYEDSNNARHGLLYDAGTFYSLDYPGAVETDFIYGINNANQIAGYYINANGEYHGLLVQVTPEPGSVALLVGMGVAGAGFLRRRKNRTR